MSEFVEVLGKLKPKNWQNGAIFHLADSGDINFEFESTAVYQPKSLVLYQGNWFVRNGTISGYNAGVLPTDTNFFKPLNPGRDLGHYDTLEDLQTAYPSPNPGSIATYGDETILVRWNHSIEEYEELGGLGGEITGTIAVYSTSGGVFYFGRDESYSPKPLGYFAVYADSQLYNVGNQLSLNMSVNGAGNNGRWELAVSGNDEGLDQTYEIKATYFGLKLDANFTTAGSAQIRLDAVFGLLLNYTDSSGKSSSFRIHETAGMLITDDNNKGLEYAADYSANYTDRSLVDKAYVDGSLTKKGEKVFYVSDLDTISKFMIYKGSRNIGEVIILSELDAVSFEVSLDDPVSWVAQADIPALQSWIGTNVSTENTLWRLRVLTTFGAGKSGEVPVVLLFV